MPLKRSSRSPDSGCRTPICGSATWRPCPMRTTRSISSRGSTRSSSPMTSWPRCARQVGGRHERNDLEAMKEIVRPFMPPRPVDAPPEPEYSEPGVLEGLAGQAGLTPRSAFDTSSAFEFPDEDTMRRALCAPAGLARLGGSEREQQFKDALSTG